MNFYLLNKVENIIEKEEIACNKQFIFCQKCFQTSSAAADASVKREGLTKLLSILDILYKIRLNVRHLIYSTHDIFQWYSLYSC